MTHILAIATNIPALLMSSFVVQGHIFALDIVVLHFSENILLLQCIYLRIFYICSGKQYKNSFHSVKVLSNMMRKRFPHAHFTWVSCKFNLTNRRLLGLNSVWAVLHASLHCPQQTTEVSLTTNVWMQVKQRRLHFPKEKINKLLSLHVRHGFR